MKTESTPQVLVFLRADLGVMRRFADASLGDREPPTGTLRGLCVNCDRRYDCTYPKSPLGVWSCDEYV